MFNTKPETDSALLLDGSKVMLKGKATDYCKEADGCSIDPEKRNFEEAGVKYVDVSLVSGHINSFPKMTSEILKKAEQKATIYFVGDQPSSLGLGYLADLYKYLRNNFESKQDGNISPINLSYMASTKKDAKTAATTFDYGTLKFNYKSSVYGCSTKQMLDDKSKFPSSLRMQKVIQHSSNNINV